MVYYYSSLFFYGWLKDLAIKTPKPSAISAIDESIAFLAIAKSFKPRIELFKLINFLVEYSDIF